MTRDRVDELLKDYRETMARCEYLRAQVSTLEMSLQANENSMIGDMVSMSQAITGMPHGTTVGDPVGNLALDIVMGNVTVFVKQIQEELTEIHKELNLKQHVVSYVDAWLKCLNDRERIVVESKAIDDMSWADVVIQANRKFGGTFSKHTAQRIFDRAMEKIYAVAGASARATKV